MVRQTAREGYYNPSRNEQEDKGRKFILAVVFFFASVAQTQTLDTVIHFPKSVFMCFYIPEGNKLYNGCGDAVYILDCSTLRLRAIISLSNWMVARAYPCWAYKHNKIYLPFMRYAPDTSILAVINNSNDSLITILPINCLIDGEFLHSIAYSATSDKLYVVGVGSITIIDPATDTIIKTIRPSGYTPGDMAIWDSIGNKVYVGSIVWTNPDRVTVIDCQTDSVIRVIRTGIYCPVVAAYSTLSHKLYVGGEWGDRRVAVIDCEYDTVIKRFNNIYSDCDYSPVYASQVNKVYWPSWMGHTDTVFVIDCDTDSIVRTISELLGESLRLWGCGGTYAKWSNRFYLPMRIDTISILAVFDCETDSLIGYVRLSRYNNFATDIVYNPVDRKIYVLVPGDRAIYVFRDSLQGIAEGQITSQVSQSSVPTFISNLLLLPESGMGENQKAVLMDVSGRRVLKLKPGANDVRFLSPGIYFVRNQARNSNVTRVVIIR